MEGEVNGSKTIIVTGQNAERIPLNQIDGVNDLKNVIKGMGVTARSAETKKVIAVLMEEVISKLERNNP